MSAIDLLFEAESADAAGRGAEDPSVAKILEGVADLIFVVDAAGLIELASESVARRLGPGSGSVGAPFLRLVHPDERHDAMSFLERSRRERGARTIELRLSGSSSQVAFYELCASAVHREGAEQSLVITARDLRDRKRRELDPTQSEHLSALGRLATTVAHEVNNVLMGMQPFAELLQRPHLDPVIAAKAGSHIASSIQRGRRVATEILRYARPAAPSLEPLDLAEWWTHFSPELLMHIRDEIVIEVAIQPGLGLLADPLQLAQVFSNLIVNARDAMPGGGRISVRGEHCVASSARDAGSISEFVRISVEDTGAGMSPKVAARAFEPLFTTKTIGGTGLGLAVVQQVVESHGGEIMLDTARGRGCRFDILLPLVAPLEAVDVADEPVANLRTGLTVLIVEDEPFIREGLEALLETSHAVTHCAGSGREALAMLPDIRPDVILLDVGLPDMNGVEVFEGIRRQSPGMPVIFATGHGDERVLRQIAADPNTRLLQKPFAYPDLERAIGELT